MIGNESKWRQSEAGRWANDERKINRSSSPAMRLTQDNKSSETSSLDDRTPHPSDRDLDTPLFPMSLNARHERHDMGNFWGVGTSEPEQTVVIKTFFHPVNA